MRQNPGHFLALLALTKFKVHDFESRTIWIKDLRQDGHPDSFLYQRAGAASSATTLLGSGTCTINKSH